MVGSMTTRILAAGLALLALPVTARAQDAPESLELTPPSIEEEPVLPATTLELEGEPEPAPEPERPRTILYRVGGRPGDRLPGEEEGEQEGEQPLPDDVAFVLPSASGDAVGDLRRRDGAQGRLRLPGQTPPPPPLYTLAIGAGFSRMLATEAIDYLRLEQRFEARLESAQEFRFGVGVAEMIGIDVLVEAGPRVGFGATFCNEAELTCEAVIDLQPGILVGENRLAFDIAATLNVHLLVARIFQPSIHGTFSFFDGITMVSLTGQLGLSF